jgi:hypothetical protein
MAALKAVAVLVPVVVMTATNLHVIVVAVMVTTHLLVMVGRWSVAVILGRRGHGRRRGGDSHEGDQETFHGRMSLF